MSTISIRPACADDLGFIGTLLARSCTVRAEGTGYPRCDDENELLAELALYDNRLEDHVFTACDADGAPIGMGGFLVSDSDSAAYLIGPLLDGPWRTVDNARAVLRLLMDQSIAPPAVASYLEEENVVLAQALRASGWEPGPAQLEMVCPLPVPTATGSPLADQATLRRLRGAADPAFPVLAKLLASHHRWSSDPLERLGDYLDDGYQVVVMESAGRPAGCVLWIPVPDTDFGRLDYLSVAEEFRGRGFGSALTRQALAEAAADGRIERIYLSVDPANEIARRLYLACGFEAGTSSRKYSYRQQSG
ncbi:GNAT family N-acetyltransferase [Nocardia cyriacigeorgica]|uniref:GNAT family N-acetyltransferase n=1 Tax=Nocardia cyriacigeorgica TaxID=135487 RepID=UPI002456859F|nr:GNAT family N-acetyltransferase [Nocardia cyriacigeorgica]